MAKAKVSLRRTQAIGWGAGAVVLAVLLSVASFYQGDAGDPRNPRALRREGERRLKMGDPAGAEAYLARVVRRAPRDAEAWTMLGRARTELGRYSLARDALRRAVAIAPTSEKPHLALAELYTAEDEPDGALRELRRAQQLAPEQPEPALQIARTLIATTRLAEARAELRRLLDRAPGNEAAMLLLIHSYEAASDRRGALAAAADAASRAPRLASVIRKLAELELASGDPNAARQSYRRLRTLSPNDAAVAVSLGTLLMGGGDCAAAEREFDAAILLGGELDATRAVRALAWTGLGTCRLGRGDTGGAFEAYSRAVSIDPAAAEAHYALAPLWLDRGEPERAARALETVLASYGDAAATWVLYGRVRLAQGDWAQARYCFDQAVTRDRRAPGAARGLGIALLGLGEVGPAIRELEFAVSLGGETTRDYDARVALGAAYAAAGRMAAARAEWARARAQRPGAADAWAHEADLEIRAGNAAAALALVRRAKRSVGEPSFALLEVESRALFRLGREVEALGAAEAALGAAKTPRERDHAHALAASRP